MLPMHPHPHEGEILSSWMVRLAFANGLPLHTFYSYFLGYSEPIWSRDIDRHPPWALLELLNSRTQQPVAVIQGLALSSYNGLLFEELPMNGDAPWLLAAGVYHRIRRRAGMQFCPLCLREDPTAYYRRSWRLALYVMCDLHYCLMHQHCPACGSTVAFHRHGIGRGRFIQDNAARFCHLCNFDLGCTIPEMLKWPDSGSQQALGEMLGVLRGAGWSFGPMMPCADILFFRGLRVLVGIICGRHGSRIRKIVGDTLDVVIEPIPQLDFEYQNATQRMKILLAAMWMLGSWPHRFLQVCRQAHFTRSRLTDSLPNLPFWLACVVDEHLDARTYIANEIEIGAAIAYLAGHYQSITWQSLGELLGLTRDVAKGALKAWESHLREI